MLEKITVQISKKEIKLKEDHVRKIICRDLRLFDMYIKENNIYYYNEIKSPITIKIYDQFDKHKGRTAFKVITYYNPENHLIGIGNIINIEMNFSPFPTLECIERTAHHEAAHIIKHIKHNRFDDEDEHGRKFTNILKRLDKNLDKDICKECHFANKKIYVEKGDG